MMNDFQDIVARVRGIAADLSSLVDEIATALAQVGGGAGTSESAVGAEPAGTDEGAVGVERAAEAESAGTPEPAAVPESAEQNEPAAPVESTVSVEPVAGVNPNPQDYPPAAAPVESAGEAEASSGPDTAVL